jgi:hypothetical protein
MPTSTDPPASMIRPASTGGAAFEPVNASFGGAVVVGATWGAVFGQATATDAEAWPDPSFDELTEAVLFTVPQVAWVVGEVT